MTIAMRRAALLAAVLGLAAAGLATGAWHLLRSQARVARAAIGKPLGEDGYQVDRIYPVSYTHLTLPTILLV